MQSKGIGTEDLQGCGSERLVASKLDAYSAGGRISCGRLWWWGLRRPLPQLPGQRQAAACKLLHHARVALARAGRICTTRTKPSGMICPAAWHACRASSTAEVSCGESVASCLGPHALHASTSGKTTWGER